MKNLTKLFSLLFLASGLLFVSCKKDDKKDDNTNPPASTVPAPTALAVSDITSVSANFTWTGSGDSYEIMVGSQTYTSTTTSYSATGLTANTDYTWKVRAKKGSDYSSWVNGTSFKTLAASSGSVSVTFGTNTWTASSISGLTNGSLFQLVAMKVAEQYPIIRMVGENKVGTYTIDDSYGYIMDYFEAGGWTIQQKPYGDWTIIEGTLTITKAANNVVSGSLDGTAINTGYLIGQEDAKTPTAIKCTFTDITLQQSSQAVAKNRIDIFGIKNSDILQKAEFFTIK